MKKSTIITTIVFGVTMLLSSNVNAQKFPDLDKSPMDMASYPNDYKDPAKLVRIIYSRPQLKGRDLSTLIPDGKVWRTGANEAAEITFYKDVKLGDKKIKAGSYTLFLLPEKNTCTVILSKDLNVWGSYTYKEANDVARLSITPTEAADSLEAFSMVFTKADKGVVLNIGWDKVRVAVPFTE
ncbi:DUF2911 domain-containing protein [Flavobacterium sp. GA093]|uniref:DUF2911 domain-containing protein n=1 Tax=Flavobacterium hydrocarbonoxydans TaxID=2683249 RepID=A0A6I4NTV7_9FLAO|nr:DUF2911 domain-containing protein [Flavobacterium hydrocarbonoxydans]MWB96512.1 DUF2911 domain-containing protein [Flavobacterium hydrocarbonoxydans]